MRKLKKPIYSLIAYCMLFTSCIPENILEYVDFSQLTDSINVNINVNDIQEMENQYNVINNAIDIVFIAEGFSSQQELLLFDDYVTMAKNGLLEYEAFGESEDFFRFHTIRTVSNESGTSTRAHVSNSIIENIKDTYWNVYSNAIGLQRAFDIPAQDKVRLDAAIDSRFHYSNKNVYPVIICNTGMYGGSGSFPLKCSNDKPLTISSLDTEFNLFVPLFVHEFMHSFGDLDDEYDDVETANKIMLYHPVLWSAEDKLNITSDTINKRKWDNLIPNPQYIEGGRYVATGKFRSSETSLMRSVAEPMSELQKELIRQRIQEEMLCIE